MISRLIGIVTALLLAAAAGVAAETAVQCELTVYCKDTLATGRGEMVYRDTANFVKGIRTTGFIANFSIELQFDQIDSDLCAFATHVVTLGPSAYTTSRRFMAEYGLPARLEPIPAKEGTSYSLVIEPLARTTVDTAGCSLLHYRKDDFRFDPSANVDIYFAPRTHGDYYWNAVKSLLEDRYRRFADVNKFSLPGKYLMYLSPCLIQSVLWDKRFGTMVDPVHSTTYALFDKEFNGADPYLIMLASVYRNYGYAPPLLAEGFAGYLSFAIYDMKQIARDGKTVPLETLLNPESFYRGDPRIVDATSGTFIRFLIDEYKVDRFLSLYKSASDLNLKQAIEKTYGKPLLVLQGEWRAYVDTVKIQYDQYQYWSMQSELMNNFAAMKTYREEQIKSAQTLLDTLNCMKEVARAHFFVGDYAGAVERARQQVRLTDTVAQDWMSLGAYHLMVGANDSALADLTRARQLDTSDQLVVFNLGLCYHVMGQDKMAIELLNQYTTVNGKSPAIAESRVLLANLLRTTGNAADEGLARDYFHQARVMYSSFTSGALISSAALVWTGIAQLGSGDTGSAREYLTMALFLENRPFYEGLINLWLGKTADVRGEHDVAQQYYRQVLNGAAPEYQQAEARQLLEHPYKR